MRLSVPPSPSSPSSDLTFSSHLPAGLDKAGKLNGTYALDKYGYDSQGYNLAGRNKDGFNALGPSSFLSRPAGPFPLGQP